MGVYQYTDPQTQRSYNFSIAGDVPSEEDFAKIRQYLDTERADYGQKYQDVFGEEFDPDGEMAFRRSLRRGYQGIKEAVGETIGTAGEEAGLGFLANFGQGMEEKAQQRLGALSLEQPTPLQSTDVDSIGTALTYAGEVVGQQIPQLGLGLGAAVLGTAAAPAVPFAGAIVGATAAGVATAPVLFGNNIQRQEDLVATGKKDKVDVGAALKATFGQAALEGVADKILLGGLFRPLGKSIFTRTTSRFTGGATTEGLTEVGQQMLERSQAGLPIDSEDAIAEYREAAIAGGLIGGGTRTTFGAFQGTDTTTDKDDATTDTETTPDVTDETDAADAQEVDFNLFKDMEGAREANTALNVALNEAVQMDDFETAKEYMRGVQQEYADFGAFDTEPREIILTKLREVLDPITPTPAQQQEEANAADPTAPKGKAEETELDRAAATAAVATDTDRAAAIAKEEANKVKTAENKAQEFIDEAKAKTTTQSVRGDRAAAIESEQTGEQIEVKKDVDDEYVTNLFADPKDKDTIDDEFLAGLNVPKVALIRRKKGVKSLIGKKKSDPETIQALRDYVNVSSIPEAKEGVQSYLDTLEVADAETDTTGARGSVEGSGPSVVGGAGVRSGVESAEDVTPSDDAGLGGDLQPTDRTVVPTAEQSDALTEIADRATATPVETPPPNLTMPLVPQRSVRGTATPTGQFIPPPVAPEARPEAPVQAAPVPQEQLQAIEDQRNAAAQSAINQAFQKQPEAIQQYYEQRVADEQDATVLPDTMTALDKEGIVELLSMKKKDLDQSQKAARLYFERFRRPVEALSEIGGFTVVGPSRTFKKDYKTPEQLKFYTGLTQGSATEARKWVFDNLSKQSNEVVRTARVQAKRGGSNYSPADKFIEIRKFAEETIKKEQNAYNKQLSRQAEDFTEASRSAKAAERLKLDDSMRGLGAIQGAEQEFFRVTTPIKGKTAFDAYLLSMGFKQRKLPKQDDYVTYDPNDNNRILSDAEIMDFYDGWVFSRDQGLLLINPVHGLDMALLPSVKNALDRGNLRAALEGIAATTDVERISNIADKLAAVVGDTRVQVVPDLSQIAGRTAAGLFAPETNTIFIDANRGMNVHTILHEMTHAATSAALANPSLPETKQIQQVFNAVREQLSDEYGTQNIDEFVAEAFSNPEFQGALALTKMDGGKTTAWNKFTRAVVRRVRKLMGLSPSSDTLTEVDRIIEGVLAPAPATRAAPNMLSIAETPKGSLSLLQGMANVVPVSAKNKADELFDVIVQEPLGKQASDFVNRFYPANVLTDKLASEKIIPFAKELNVIINKMSGEHREKTLQHDTLTNNQFKWQRKYPKQSKVLNNIIPRSTFLEIDPSRTDEKYMKTINESKEKQQEYKELRKEFKKLNKEGQDLYKTLRNYFATSYKDILEALDTRLKATIPDAQVQKTAFRRIQEILQKESGVITPYFPLMRKGGYRLAYVALSQKTGQPDQFVEYYSTLKKAQKAAENLKGVKGVQDVLIQKSTNAMNFDNAPSTSFVRNVLDTIQLRREDFRTEEDYRQTMQSIVDLTLDAMPERSFMQNFRRRKGVRGFIGDTTPTGMGGVEFDTYTMLKEKGRDLNRQLIQMKYSAELEGFIKKLSEPINGVSGPNYFENIESAKPAETLRKMAEFAKAPNVNRFSQIANNVGFGFTMGLNFSSAAITFFDVAMSAMPVLAGTYGVGNTARAYGTATKALAGAPATRTVMVMGPDNVEIPQEVNMGVAGKSISNYTPEELRRLFGDDVRMDILVEMGDTQAQFNQSMIQEQLEIGQGNSMEMINKTSSFMFHHAERVNRETTLTSAYLLEVQNMQKKRGNLTEADYQEAAQKAIDNTEFTLGATAAAGRPVFAQTAYGNILFLFKRFAVSKYYMMMKLANESIGTTNVDKIMADEGVTLEQAQEIATNRRAARYASRNFLVMTGLLSGIGGLPMMGAIGAIYNLLKDDDEDDFESALRKSVTELPFQGLANELLGVDVASRVALNSLLYRPPIIEKDQSPLFTLLEQVGGPTLGTANSIFQRGIPDIYRGLVDNDMKTLQRGFEASTPASIRNISKATRYGFEGATTRRGDPITEDISPYNAVMQGLGFAPQRVAEVLDYNKNEIRKSKALKRKRGKLLRRRNMAIREGDFDEVNRVMALIQEFNNSLKPEERKARITSRTLKSSQSAFKRTSGKMRGGVTYDSAMEASLEEYDQGFRLFR